MCKPSMVYFLVVAIFISTLSFAQGIRSGGATLTICNKGRSPINVLRATGSSVTFSTDKEVLAWTHLEPAKCAQVYSGVGDPNTGSGPAHSFIGFGFYNSEG